MLWAVLGVASLLIASGTLGAFGIADREREVVFGVWHLLWGGAVLFVFPALGFLLQQTGRQRPRIVHVLPFVLAVAAAYLLVADIRLDVRGDDVGFAVDHALPEIFIPPVVVLIAGAGLARALSVTPSARRAWSVVTFVACVLLLGLLVRTVMSADTRLDAPGTVASLTFAAVYAAVAIAGDRGMPFGPRSRPPKVRTKF